MATLSNGKDIENPRWTRQHEDRIAAANQALARKEKRSNNRIRAREVLHRAHQRAANARRNYLYHVSKRLVANYDLIAHEAQRQRHGAESFRQVHHGCCVGNVHLATDIQS